MMKIKENNFLRNVHTKWINMLALTKWAMEEYRTILIKRLLMCQKKQRLLQTWITKWMWKVYWVCHVFVGRIA